MTVRATSTGDRGSRAATRNSKLVGLAFLIPPITLFLTFAIGEGIGGEEGWWGHLIQLAVAALLGLGAWAWPRVGGAALILSGIAFGAWVIMVSEFPAGLAALAIVGVPLIVSGAFLVRSGSAG